MCNCTVAGVCIIVVVYSFQVCNHSQCGFLDSLGDHLLSQVGIILIVYSVVGVVDDCYCAFVMCNHYVCVVFSDTVQQWC